MLRSMSRGAAPKPSRNRLMPVLCAMHATPVQIPTCVEQLASQHETNLDASGPLLIESRRVLEVRDQAAPAPPPPPTIPLFREWPEAMRLGKF